MGTEENGNAHSRSSEKERKKNIERVVYEEARPNSSVIVNYFFYMPYIKSIASFDYLPLSLHDV